jgi:hypothetical protein
MQTFQSIKPLILDFTGEIEELILEHVIDNGLDVIHFAG